MNDASPSPSSPTDEILRRLARAVGLSPDQTPSDEALIGFFQTFRPSADGLLEAMASVPQAEALVERLEELFAVSGDDRRPGGGRDAYFIVRQPRAISPDAVRAAGRMWIDRLMALASELDQPEASLSLRAIETIRVLEGTPPKHPRATNEKSSLLKTLQVSVPDWTTRIDEAPDVAARLRTPYYYINCDPMLRDYLMWPLYAATIAVPDPFAPYFELWRHGVKYRAYRDDQLDLYMPRMGS